VLVLDASAAVQYALAADGYALLGRRELVGPALLWSEVSSVLHELAWRRSISTELAQQAFARFLAARIGARRSVRVASEAWRIADRFGWAKTYDAEYVALARSLRCPLLTIDARLRRTVSNMVEVLGPSDL
jgi:predicted nucleic acid-binding protein